MDRFLRRLSLKWRLAIATSLILLGSGLLILVGFLTGLRPVIFFSSETSLGAQILAVGALILAVLGLGFMFLAMRSINIQLGEIRAGVDRLRGGMFNVDLPDETVDEIGVLARSVNQLGGHLLKVKAEQEHSVDERTNALKEYAVQLQAVSDLAREAVTLQDLDVLTMRSVNLIQDRFNFYYVAIYLVDDERGFVILKAATGSAGAVHLERGVKIRLGDVNVVSNVVGSGEPRFINDVTLDYVFHKDPLLPETQAEAVIPLQAGHEVIGVLDVQSTVPNAFGEAEVVILQVIVDQLTIAIQNTRLMKNLQRSVDEANSLYQRYTQSIWSQEALGKRVGGYEYNLLEVTAADHKLPERIFERLKNGKAIPVSSKELQGGESDFDNQVLLIPLMMYNQLVGVVGLEADEPSREWSEDELSVIEAVTNQIALSLDNARLLEESQLRSGQLRLLQEVTAVAASHTNLLELLDNVSQKLRASFNVLHCGMFLFEPDGQTLNLVANASTEPFLPGARLLGTKISFEKDSFLHQILKTRKSLIINYVGSQLSLAKMREFLQVRGTETIVFIPLLSRGEVIGVASLELAGQERVFSSADLQLMDQISLQIASAIDVARSFEQATQRAERERMVADISSRIRETLDIQTILKTAAQEVRQALGVPEVTVKLSASPQELDRIR